MKFKILLIFVFVIIVTMEVFALVKKSPEPRGDSWQERIESLGAEEAFQDFKRENDSNTFGNQHSEAHKFGEALYFALNVSGITMCSSDYGFGCYHGFFARALSEEGLTILQELDKACTDKFGLGGQGCQHGIGHGLLEYVGHNNVNKALEECGKLEWKKELLGCQGGVFMEYHSPLVGQGENFKTTIKTFDSSIPYDPCHIVPGKFRTACFFSLGEWWGRNLKMELSKMGELCGNLNSLADKIICYKGVGYGMANIFDLNISKDIENCSIVTKEDEEYNVYCRAGVYWALWNINHYREEAENLCIGLENEEICLEEGNIAKSLES